MKEKTFMAGFGGQGIISMGQVWVYCAMKEGLEVTFFPFYGAEKRGGIARASVIVSDGRIASPLVTQADSVVVMNQDSLDIALASARPGAVVLVNSSLVRRDPERTNILLVRVPCNEIAIRMGDVRIANMVMMGALASATGALTLDHMESEFRSFFPAAKHHLIDINIAAVMAGQKVTGPVR